MLKSFLIFPSLLSSLLSQEAAIYPSRCFHPSKWISIYLHTYTMCKNTHAICESSVLNVLFCNLFCSPSIIHFSAVGAQCG